MPHNDVQSLDGLKGHPHLIASQRPLQVLQIHLCYVLQANLWAWREREETRDRVGDRREEEEEERRGEKRIAGIGKGKVE